LAKLTETIKQSIDRHVRVNQQIHAL